MRLHELRPFTSISEITQQSLHQCCQAGITVGGRNGGRGSRVGKVSDRGWLCQEFEPSTTKGSLVKIVLFVTVERGLKKRTDFEVHVSKTQ
ncbi:hypothetical protein TNCV_992981 [Trichonephila clavipes]|nr:hypothetical protein TNCV_992981 [Trichonephila clavipes]